MDCKNGSAEYECTYNKYIIIYKSFLHSCNVGYSAMEEIKENQPISRQSYCFILLSLYKYTCTLTYIGFLFTRMYSHFHGYTHNVGERINWCIHTINDTYIASCMQCWLVTLIHVHNATFMQ